MRVLRGWIAVAFVMAALIPSGAGAAEFMPRALVKTLWDATANDVGREKKPFSPYQTYRAGAIFLGMLVAEPQTSGYVYVEAQQFRATGRLRQYWETLVFGPRNRKFGHRMQFITLNCDTYSSTLNELVFYDRKGRVKGHQQLYQESRLIPGSIGAAIADAVCAIRPPVNADRPHWVEYQEADEEAAAEQDRHAERFKKLLQDSQDILKPAPTPTPPNGALRPEWIDRLPPTPSPAPNELQ